MDLGYFVDLAVDGLVFIKFFWVFFIKFFFNNLCITIKNNVVMYWYTEARRTLIGASLT